MKRLNQLSENSLLYLISITFGLCILTMPSIISITGMFMRYILEHNFPIHRGTISTLLLLISWSSVCMLGIASIVALRKTWELTPRTLFSKVKYYILLAVLIGLSDYINLQAYTYVATDTNSNQLVATYAPWALIYDNICLFSIIPLILACVISMYNHYNPRNSTI